MTSLSFFFSFFSFCVCVCFWIALSHMFPLSLALLWVVLLLAETILLYCCGGFMHEIGWFYFYYVLWCPMWYLNSVWTLSIDFYIIFFRFMCRKYLARRFFNNLSFTSSVTSLLNYRKYKSTKFRLKNSALQACWIFWKHP